MDIASETHLEVLCNSIQDIKRDYIKKENKIISKHDKQIKTLQDYISKQNIIIKDLRKAQQTMENNFQNVQQNYKETSQRTVTLTQEISRLKIQNNVFEEELNEFRNNSHYGSLLWKITNVSDHIKNAKDNTEKSIYSKQFYTHIYGYKIQAQLFLNGVGKYTSEYVAVYFHIIPTDHDNILAWPFKKKVTFSILEQCDDIDAADNITYTVIPDVSNPFYKKPSSDINGGQGYSKFVAVSKLHAGNYIKDDCMFLKIKAHSGKPCKHKMSTSKT